MKKKTSWDYQRDRYKQISIKFRPGDDEDDLIYWYLTNKVANKSGLIKDLIMEQIFKEANEDE